MQSNRPRSDLVVSMTIAEMFLLLVFMVWYVSTSENNSPGQIGVLQAENARLKQENDSLERAFRRLKAEKDEFEKALKFWQTRFGIYPPATEVELQNAMREMGRGKPKCQDQNLVVKARVVDDVISAEILSPLLVPQQISAVGANAYTVGTVIRTDDEIERLFRTVHVIEASGGPSGGGCRFDYRLEYGTYKDYYVGRERFEAAFYAAAKPKRVSETN